MITNRFNSILSTIGEEVLVNNVPVNVVITNPTIKDVEQRYFHSLIQINQWDVINYEGQNFLSLTENNGKRHDKYKVLAEWCNNIYKIHGASKRIPRIDPETGKIVVDNYGRPIMQTISGDITDVPCIVKNLDYPLLENS